MKTGGTWTQQEIRMHKNELELRALKLALESTGGKVTACKDGQYSCPDLPFENGGRKEFANGLSFQTNLGTAIKEKTKCDSRVPSQQTEQACRHRNSSLDSFFRMEASPLTVSKTLYENGKAIEGPFCFQGVQHM